MDSSKPSLTTLATAFAVTLGAVPVAHAGDNPFAMEAFRGGVQVAADQGEMKCGASMDMGQGDAGKDGSTQTPAKSDAGQGAGAQPASGK